MGYSPSIASSPLLRSAPPLPSKRPAAQFKPGQLVEFRLYNDTTDVGLIEESFFDFKSSTYRYKISSSKRQWPQDRLSLVISRY